MKEIRDIVEACRQAKAAGKQCALATVVKVEGSSYRREGARMLITEDGCLTGAISGGCLEGDALRKAMLVMHQQKTALVTYDTTDEDDAKLGLGLGCNGIIHILIEPIIDTANDPVALLQASLEKRRLSVLVTVFSLEDPKGHQPGTCFLQNEEKVLQADSKEAFYEPLSGSALAALQSGTSKLVHHQAYTAMIEVLRPSVALIIFGAGNDAIPLVQMASVLGWEITIVDGRPAYATLARFPQAGHVVLSRPQEAMRRIGIDEQTAIVLMTHNYNYDLAMLAQLLPVTLPYIGVLGPGKKLNRMLDELADRGALPDASLLEKVHGPTGLDLGADTASEIALSILAEIQRIAEQKDSAIK